MLVRGQLKLPCLLGAKLGIQRAKPCRFGCVPEVDQMGPQCTGPVRRELSNIPVACGDPRYDRLDNLRVGDFGCVHWDRDSTKTEKRARPPRQVYHGTKIQSGMPYFDSEPKSMRDNANSSGVAFAAESAEWMFADYVTALTAGAIGHTWHTATGVRGGQFRHEIQADEVREVFRFIKDTVPGDIASNHWEQQNHYWEAGKQSRDGHPFETPPIWSDGKPDGVVRAFARTNGREAWVGYLDIKGHVDLIPKQQMGRLTIWGSTTGHPVLEDRPVAPPGYLRAKRSESRHLLVHVAA